MKKRIFTILLFLLMITPVYAKDNKLYFTEKEERIYYESKLLNEDVFMKHTDMVPGSRYTDELIIENGTATTYTLYFKVVPRKQSKMADELLDAIDMEITLDGNLIYNGSAKGLDYSSVGVNLQNSVLLGDFIPSRNSKMVVKTHLQESYSNTDFKEYSYIDWTFYAQYENNTWEIIPIPKTGIGFVQKSIPYLPWIGILFIVIILYGVYKIREKKERV